LALGSHLNTMVFHPQGYTCVSSFFFILLCNP
jgi:hypothetical protein